MTKTNKIIIVIVCLLAAGLFIYSQPRANNQPADQNFEQTVLSDLSDSTETITIDYIVADLLAEELLVAPGTTVLDVLTDLAGAGEGFELEIKTYEGLGSLVVAIGDRQNGTDNNYWQYYVNDQLPLVSADAYQLQAGDRVNWLFAVSEF